MGLLSIFKRNGEPTVAAGVASEPADAVQCARVRARQRLIGAAVLVVIGVIGFPLVFETQPRPIPVDIPIELPRKDGAAPLAMPPARAPEAAGPAAGARAVAPRPVATAPTPPAPAAAARPADAGEMITESKDDAGKPVGSASPTSSSSSTASAAAAATAAATAARVVKPAAPKPTSVAALEPSPKPTAAGPKPAAPAVDSARAKALLEGKPVAAAEGERFIVQVGAFADAGSARDARSKVEKLGLKTYTQVANTPAGSRIRVRVGPFASRSEADQALTRARGAGLAAVVLTL